uniref:C-type lectin domain-containing protein n=1 Tax=Plectus sambesii TaxID=2011161 RepID=A0A914W959_9BILA
MLDMFLQLIILLTACSLAMGITDLETQCNSIGGGLTHTYANGSCYVLHLQATKYFVAKASCYDILGYGGHLIHPKSSAEVNLSLSLMQTVSIENMWLGVEQPDWNSPDNAGWYYTTPMGDYSPATYLQWSGGEPNGGIGPNAENIAAFAFSRRSYIDYAPSQTIPYFCQYEESRKQLVTDLEQKCASVNSSLTHVYANGNCYIFHPQTAPYFVAKLSCNDFAGYDGHLAHLKSANDTNMAESLMRASTAGNNYTWIGVEQPDWNAANTVGWSYTTPTTESVLATYLPWLSGEPSGGTTENNAAFSVGNPTNYQDFPYSASFSYLCQYEPSSQRNVTALETSCNQLATPNKYYYAGTCFFESASAATYSAKKTACPPMAPYYASLAILDTAEKRILARNIGKKSLNAASSPVTNLAYWTGLEQQPACPNNACNEEPDKSWYWVDSAGYAHFADLSSQGWANTYFGTGTTTINNNIYNNDINNNNVNNNSNYNHDYNINYYTDYNTDYNIDYDNNYRNTEYNTDYNSDYNTYSNRDSL